MQSLKEQEDLNWTQSISILIWASILLSLVVYAIAIILKDQMPLFTFEPALEPSMLTTVRLTLMFISAVILILAPTVYRKALASAYGRTVTSEQEVIGLTRSTYITALVIVMAMYEAIGIFALILAYMGAGENTVIGFMGVSAVAMLTARPKEEALMEHFEKVKKA